MTKLTKNGKTVFEGTKKQSYDFFKKEVGEKYAELYWQMPKHHKIIYTDTDVWEFKIVICY